MIALALTALLAAAGGGSSGFGGGGGGGGGGGSYGGGGAYGGSGGGGVFLLLVIALVVIAVVLTSALQTRRVRKRRAARRRQVELAAAEAADDDPLLAADMVVQAAERIFLAAQEAWDACDDPRLAQLLDADLLVEWRRRLTDFAARGWRNRVEVLGIDAIEYLGLVNREGTKDDRVTVRITARLRDYVETDAGMRVMREGATSDVVRLTEYWTFGRRDAGWIVASIESDAEGAHVLDEDIVATPWGDEQRMRDASIVEVAAADKLPDGVSTADVADLDYAGDARAAALDLSLADARWSPDVLEAAARRAVAAWAEAVDGADHDLLDVATPAAASALLHPGDPSGKTRLVIRGPQVARLRIAALDPAAVPPTMTVEVAVRGRRYVEDRDTAAMLSGSKSRETIVVERWTLALAGPDDRPWQVVDAAAADVRA
ncbi:MAG TPA: TIM44-like domain-containing protein [Conexibacter sp.]|jgi:predicted lipid-binding transport protein (Tim44 family)|nr:TIM44-like domain-containing protein [Conexibacter sp.]